MAPMLEGMQAKEMTEEANQDAFGKALQRLPVELILEVVGRLTLDEEKPRSRQATALLQALMSVNRYFRRAIWPVFWSEVHLSSRSDVSCRVAIYHVPKTRSQGSELILYLCWHGHVIESSGTDCETGFAARSPKENRPYLVLALSLDWCSTSAGMDRGLSTASDPETSLRWPSI